MDIVAKSPEDRNLVELNKPSQTYSNSTKKQKKKTKANRKNKLKKKDAITTTCQSSKKDKFPMKI